jgi:hypothetical protein
MTDSSEINKRLLLLDGKSVGTYEIMKAAQAHYRPQVKLLANTQT